MKTFSELGIRSEFIKGIEELGIKVPTEIQEQVIPMLLNKQTDLIGQAQTGTGKTAAFGLPLLHKMDPKKDHIQGLILCPTRELGQQVAKQLFKFTKYTEKIFIEAVYGGEHIDRQLSSLSRTTHIIVATPGRLIDLVERKAVDLSRVETVILDEADEMLSMGFKAELDQILKFTEKAKCKWLFSATMPDGIKEIVNKHLSADAQRVQVSARSVGNKNINHQFVVCSDQDKIYAIQQFLNTQPDNRGVIFCRTKAESVKLTKQLLAKNISSATINGDLMQKERDKVMRAFRNGSAHILVATDIAARGLDVNDLSFVIHYTLPDQDEYYTHRSGRTARAGKSGISLCLVSTPEIKLLRVYEQKFGCKFKEIK